MKAGPDQRLASSDPDREKRVEPYPLELVQGYLAHKKTPNPLGPPEGPRHRPTVGS